MPMMAAYAITIFTGAFLLFQVQPLIGKYILPWFGGGPGVWTTCMLFFQVVLLAGYAYAHLTSRWLRPRAQAIVHLTLAVIALALLPVTPSDSWKPGGAGNPTVPILVLLTASIGLPYFVLAATGPLMQQWFSRTKPGVSPYRLYALSNFGSLLALATYPSFFETHFTRKTQAGLWGWGLAVYAAGCVVCALNFWRTKGGGGQKPEVSGDERRIANQGAGRPSRPATNKLLWLLLPACASLLLLAVTNKICQDVAVIPFLWVLPLSLYLLSFIISFDSPRWYKRFPFALALAAALGAMCWAQFRGAPASIIVQLIIYSAGLFICCMVCHGELYRLKPDPRHLTAFYLMIAAGGALGGVFVGVIAPLIFTDYFELHWGLVLCAGLFLLVWGRDPKTQLGPWRWPAYGGWMAGLAALIVALWFQAHKQRDAMVYRSRNFYGVLKILKGAGAPNNYYHELVNGNISHGLQLLYPEFASWPTGYYSENSGVGQAIRALPSHNRRIALVGLGVGTVATYAQAGDLVRIYEINPKVVQLAESSFTYLKNCAGKVETVLGDARLSLEREPPQNFDLLVLDAFTSDAIPVHLLTEEAFTTYKRHLKPKGIIAIHISNNHLDLEPVVTTLARQFNYQMSVIENVDTEGRWWVRSSAWVLLSRSEETMSAPSICGSARRPRTDLAKVPLWTDDFLSLYEILRFEGRPPIGPGIPEAKAGVASGLWDKGDFAGAIAAYREALELDPDFAEALNNLAWLLATSPQASFRKGTEAVELAEHACRLTDYHRTLMVGTLAAAYAEAGRFEEAVVTAQKACALAAEAGDETLASKNQALLKLFAAKQAYQEDPTRTSGALTTSEH